MVNSGIILSFSYFYKENPLVFNPYDVISDIINDITTPLKSYISWSIRFYGIQHG